MQFERAAVRCGLAACQVVEATFRWHVHHLRLAVPAVGGSATVQVDPPSVFKTDLLRLAAYVLRPWGQSKRSGWGSASKARHVVRSLRMLWDLHAGWVG